MIIQDRNLASGKLAPALLLATLVLSPALAPAVERLDFKPGFNLFSTQQDVQVGKENSAQIDKQLPLVNDPEVLRYLNALGKKLVAFAPNNQPEYAWQFKVVNSADINAFALPGGYIYVNRGAIDAAENEAQLAGVISHESGHVVMRHGTHMATQAIPFELLMGVMGQGQTLAGQLARAGIGFGVNSIMLHNSRNAESQADEVGTYILYQAGYDPHAMVQFFQIIEKKYPQRTLQFFSDHPNPENRIKDVDAEIRKLGPAREVNTDNAGFERVKGQLAALPPPPQKGAPKIEAAQKPPPPPSANLIRYDGKVFALEYPDNWQVERGEGSVTLYPPGGMVSGAEGETAQAYGTAVSLYSPQHENWGLVDGTQELLESMRQSNPQLQVVQQSGINLRGNPAVSVLLQNDSPIVGQREMDQLVAVRQGTSILTFIFIAPAGAFESYSPTFDRMVQSIELAP